MEGLSRATHAPAKGAPTRVAPVLTHLGCAPPVHREARLIAARLDACDRDVTVLTDTGDFLAVLLAAALAPILAALATRAWSALVVPVVVAELLLGVVIGPDVLALASPTDLLEFLGQLGLGFLFFFAGYEIRFERVRGTPLRLATIGWVCSLALAYSLAGLLEVGGIVISGLLTGSAMATTALGTLIPLLRDTHQLDTPSGSHVLAVGAVGEFGPVLIVTLLLGATSDTATEALLLVAFVAVAVLAATLATGAVGRSWDFLERSLKTSGQLPVRLTVLSVFAPRRARRRPRARRHPGRVRGRPARADACSRARSSIASSRSSTPSASGS